jgi:hypothetical protein
MAATDSSTSTTPADVVARIAALELALVARDTRIAELVREPTNNGSKRELRRVAVGRHAWLFVASDDHAESAGHLFSLVTSSRLHKLDPEWYLRDFLRVLPHWPRDRYPELAPKFARSGRQFAGCTQIPGMPPRAPASNVTSSRGEALSMRASNCPRASFPWQALGGADHGAQGGGERSILGIERMHHDEVRRGAACG